MKLYHYVPKGNDVLTQGILSFARSPHVDLTYYFKRSGATTHSGIVKWMENCFQGRSRGIRLLIEPLQYAERTLVGIKSLIDTSDLFEVDVDALNRDGLIEAIYVSPSVLDKKPENENDELLCPLTGLADIDLTPNDYTILDDEKGWRFAFMRYYLFVMKDGIIPSKYLRKVE